jgi:SSS family solute:Na+ symporter
MMDIYLWGIAIYSAIVIAVAVIATKKAKSYEEYVVAGRSMPLWVLIGTLWASWLGAGTISGNAALYYSFGIGGLWFAFAGPAAHSVLIALSKRLRALGQYTIPDILEIRYNPIARYIGAIPAILGFTAITGYQMKAIGYVIEVITGIPGWQGFLYGAIIVIGYTFAGGIWAVAYTDVVQLLFMELGLIIGAIMAVASLGGVSAFLAKLPPAHFNLLGYFDIFKALGYFFPLFFLASIDQNLYQRMYASKDARTARYGAVALLFGAFFTFLLVMTVSMASYAANPKVKPDMAVFWAAKNLLPPWAGAILLVGALGLIMSTADSYLLSPATNISRDYVQRLWPKTTDKQLIWITRAFVLILGIIAYVLAGYFESVLAMVIVAYTIYGAALWPPVISAFFWKRANAPGAIAGILGGFAGTIIGYWLQITGVPWAKATPLIYMGIIPSIVAMVLVTLVTKPPPPEKLEPFAAKG